MYLWKIKRHTDGKMHDCWALVESHRAARGLRQRVVAYMGEMHTSGRLIIQIAGENRMDYQADLFGELELKLDGVNLNAVRVEWVRDFGNIWLALELIKRLKYMTFFIGRYSQIMH